MSEAGNVTSVALEGREIFQSPRYWPLQVDFRDKRPDDVSLANLQSYREELLTNMGLTKARQQHGHPALLRNAVEVFNDHVTKMSDYSHLAIPAMDAVALLYDGSPGGFASTAQKRLGSLWMQRTKGMIARLSHLESYSDYWSTGFQRLAVAIERNTSVSLLAWRTTSILMNRFGGKIMMAGALAAEHPGLIPSFLARSTVPTSLRLNKDVVNRLMQNGYFWHRWVEDPSHVFASLPTDARDTSKRKGALMLRWIRAKALKPMANAEIRNAVNLYRTLVANGFTPEQAVEQAEAITRRTQNPSTALEESGLYESIHKGAHGIWLPMMGQPTVAHDFLVGKWLEWRYAMRSKTGQLAATRGFAGAALASAANIALVVGLREFMRSLRDRKPPLDGEDDWLYALWTAMNELLDTLLPGSGKIVDTLQGAVGGVVNTIRGTPIHGSSQVRFDSFPVRILNLFASGMRSLVRESRQYQPVPKKVTTAMIRLIDATSAVFGLPTGGLTQIAATAGGLGEKEQKQGKGTRSTSPLAPRRIAPRHIGE